MAAVILGVGRSIGETMAVIMVAGNQPVMPGSPLNGLRTMTANIVLEMGYAADLHREALIATSVVLFVFILLINFLFSLVKRGRSDAKPFRRAGYMIAPLASLFKRQRGHSGPQYGHSGPQRGRSGPQYGHSGLVPESKKNRSRGNAFLSINAFITTAFAVFWNFLHKLLPLALRVAVLTAASATALITVFLIGYILVKGIPNITPSLFEPVYTSENVSLFPAFVNTVFITALSLLLSAPLGVFSAIYLVEYARRGNRLVRVVRIAAETLTGIPSIVYGLFGMLLFVVGLHWGYSLLAGAFTLAVMTLPLIMRTTEEALLSVPDTYREGSLGLGAGQLRTVFAIVLPAAMPGILAGIILAVGRIVGETAALIFTAGTVARIPTGLFSSARTLSVHIYSLSSEGLYLNQSYATAVLLLVLVLGINAFSSLMAKKLTAVAP
jgi:phosphate transport system permease protein